MPQLRQALKKVGMTAPVSTGRFCGVFRGPNIDMISKSTPDTGANLQAFDLGAEDATAIHRLLGKIVEATELELKILRWDPALS